MPGRTVAGRRDFFLHRQNQGPEGGRVRHIEVQAVRFSPPESSCQALHGRNRREYLADYELNAEVPEAEAEEDDEIEEDSDEAAVGVEQGAAAGRA